MENTHDIYKFLKPLADKWYIELTIELIQDAKSSKFVACVGRPWVEDPKGKFFRDGVRMSRSSYGFRLLVDESFYKLPQQEQEQVMTHEFGHILQYEFMNDIELEEMRTAPVENKWCSVTTYRKNMLEVTAECFTIRELGVSRHSVAGASSTGLVCEGFNIMCSYSPWE